jgi:hypothetical protein
MKTREIFHLSIRLLGLFFVGYGFLNIRQVWVLFAGGHWFLGLIALLLPFLVARWLLGGAEPIMRIAFPSGEQHDQ